MGANSALEHVLKEILQVVQPLHEDQEKRYQVIDELRRVIESMESLRDATVEPFGSFVSSLFTRWGDLDISIDLPNGSCISSAGKKRRKKLLGDVQIALRQRGGWQKLQLIPNARVPILKFESSRQSISCDMSIDNIQGQMKSKSLFWVSAIDGRFHDMVLLVKEWAKAHGINNPKAGTFNSYSLCLLVIFHFQTCVPAILPPLKDIYPGNLVNDLRGVRTNAEIRIKEICAANIRRFRQDRFRRVNRSSLSELFTSFLEKNCCAWRCVGESIRGADGVPVDRAGFVHWNHSLVFESLKFFDIGLKASELGICPYTGQWERIDRNMRWYPKTYTILIEDPFEQPENSARAVNMSKLTLISEAFQTTYRRLISANQNKGSLVAALVRPEVSQSIIPRPLVWNPTPNGGHHQNHPTRPQVHRSLHSISQAQHQFQNLRLGSRSNIITVQNHNQGQQMRRPRFDGYIG